MKLLQICYKVRRNIVEGAYKICRSQNITRHLLAELPCVPKPAYSHPQSSLQSVWDVGRYLSRYPVAGVAFEAPGTCKQCASQITAIFGGATFGAGTGCRQVSHLQTAQPLEGHFSRNTTWPELLSSLGTLQQRHLCATN